MSNEELFNRAQRVIPGGVNSPVRSFRSVGGTPYFVERADGPYVWDVDGRRYIDLVQSYGAIIAGHAHPAIVAAVQEAAAGGTSYGAPTEREVQLAEEIVARVPACALVRLVSSGTEATMSAIRVARGFTGRRTVVKFAGNYHGHGDLLLAESGSGVAALGLPGSAGVTDGAVRDTRVVPYNVVPELAEDVACVIVEPIAANMGVVAPAPGFLQGLRDLTKIHGALLIVDEVITGFRLRNGSVQNLFGIEADLTTLGKIIGGGLPVAAYGGRAEIMDRVAPLGPVYQAGTLAGNPLAMRAGLATLDQLSLPGTYERLEKLAATFVRALRESLRAEEIPGQVNSMGSLATLFFAPHPVKNYSDARKSDTKRYTQYFRNMLEQGVFLAPSQFEASFVSLAHTESDIDFAAKAAQDSLRQIANS